MDLSRQELLESARRAVVKYEGKAQVFFKFSCGHCGTRCTFGTPNVLFGTGECYQCGHQTVVRAGGYLLLITASAAYPNEVQDGRSSRCRTTTVENIKPSDN